MSANNGSGAATHFGRQMRKERTTHGWSLREFAAHTGIDFTTRSRIENGKRPPNETVAQACDAAFPERRNYFTELYEEMRGWSEVPAAFRNWSEYEQRAVRLCDWWPSVVSGLLQTEDYARALIAAVPGTTPETAAARLTSRTERQRRVLGRDDPPRASFVIDVMALYREVGSAAVMAGQMRRLLEVAARPNVTLQVLPGVAHNANASGFTIADDNAAYAEHVVGGFVYSDEQTVSALAVRFDTLRGECYRLSESVALLERMAESWASGVSPLTLTGTAGPA